MLTVREVAERLKVSTKTVYRLVYRGELPAYKVGRSVRVQEEDLKSFLEKQRVPTPRRYRPPRLVGTPTRALRARRR